MRPGTWAVSIVVAAVVFTNLGTARLWDRDEPRNAQCAREMMEAGDWVVPTFAGELRTHKPVLLYWGQIAAYEVFGVSEFAARLPSALAGFLTVIFVYGIARRLADEATANWASLALGTMLLFVMASRAATPDGLLVMTTTLVIALFVWFSMEPAEKVIAGSEGKGAGSLRGSVGLQGLRSIVYRWPNHRQWGLIHAGCGVAVLAKGPVGMVMPLAVIGAAIWALGFPGVHPPPNKIEATDGGVLGQPVWRRVVRCGEQIFFHGCRSVSQVAWIAWQMRPITSVFMVLCVAGPWYFAVGRATDGVWLHEFFFTHNYSRAVNAMEGHSGTPLLYYVGAFLVGTFPWSCFTIPAGVTLWRTIRKHNNPPLLTLGLIWVGVYIVGFSFAATKLPSYITPCYPGAALFFGWYFRGILTAEIAQPRWLLAALGTAMLVGITVAIAISVVLVRQLPEVGTVGISGVLLAVGSLIGVGLVRRQSLENGFRAFVVGAIGFVSVLHVWGPAAVDRSRKDIDAIQAAVEMAPKTRQWYAGLPIEPSWVFYSEDRIHSLSEYAEEGIKRKQAVGLSSFGLIERVAEGDEDAVPIFLKPIYFKIVEGIDKSQVRLAADRASIDLN